MVCADMNAAMAICVMMAVGGAAGGGPVRVGMGAREMVEVHGADLSINGSNGILGMLQRLESSVKQVEDTVLRVESEMRNVASQIAHLDAVMHVTEWGCWGVCEGGCGQPGVRRRISTVPAGITDTRACESPCFPDWRNLTAVGRAQFMDALGKLVAPGECVSQRMDRATAMPIPSGQVSAVLLYEESVLATNGMIYFPPSDALRVMKLNPTSGEMSYIGPDFGSAREKFRGAVLGTNGIVYGIPHEATSILKINANTDEVTTFGSMTVVELGSWTGGVLAPNGAIYGIPYDATQVLRINTTGDSTRLFGSISGGGKFVGGVLAPNGLIFGIPHDDSWVLVIDPATDGVSFIASGAAAGVSKWHFGAIGLDGLVYGFPLNPASVLVINPVTRSVSTIPASRAQIGGAMGPNGLIYLASTGSFPGVNALNTTSRSIAQRTLGTVSGYRGGVLAPNGAVYFSPANALLSVLRVDFPYLPPMSLPMDALLSPFLN
jgi:hypothetical protein